MKIYRLLKNKVIKKKRKFFRYSLFGSLIIHLKFYYDKRRLPLKSDHKDLYITTSNGRLIITNIKTGKIKNVLKIDNEKISRPFVKNQNMYLIRNNSILKLY